MNKQTMKRAVVIAIAGAVGSGFETSLASVPTIVRCYSASQKPSRWVAPKFL